VIRMGATPPQALRTVPRLARAGLHATRGQVSTNGSLVEGFDAKAEMLEVAPLRARRRPAGSTQFSANGNQVDQRAAGAQLNQAQIILPALHRAA
jgi:hypothetical protein